METPENRQWKIKILLWKQKNKYVGLHLENCKHKKEIKEQKYTNTYRDKEVHLGINVFLLLIKQMKAPKHMQLERGMKQVKVDKIRVCFSNCQITYPITYPKFCICTCNSSPVRPINKLQRFKRFSFSCDKIDIWHYGSYLQASHTSPIYDTTR